MDTKEIIEKLREVYSPDSYAFSMNCSWLIGGDKNKKRRVMIMEELTGEKLPARECQLTLVSNAIKASIEQLTLF